MLIYINLYEKSRMTIVNEIKPLDGCVEVPLPDKLRKNIIKEAVHRMKDNEPCEDKMLESAFMRGVVREVIMEKYPDTIDLLPKDIIKRDDVICLMGKDVECGLFTRGFIIFQAIVSSK